MRYTFWAACLPGLLQIPTVLAVDTRTCVPDCEAQVRAKFSDLKCANANDAPCLCAAPGFLEGIKQCSQSTCSATEAQVASHLNSAFCVAAPVAGASKSAAPAASSTTTVSTSVSSAYPSTSTSVAAVTTNTATSSLTTSQTSVDMSTSSSTESSQTAQSTLSTTEVASTTSSTAIGDKDNDGQGDKQNGGLSRTAVIGTAVGCAAAGVAILAIVACLLLRRRRATQPRTAPPISKPIAGTGRTAASPDPGSYEKYGNDDIEMRTNRYEEMPPQQTPRTMV